MVETEQKPALEAPAPPVPARSGHAMRALVLDIAGPIALYYGIRAAGGGVWLSLAAGGVLPAASTVGGVIARRRVDVTGAVMLAALAVSTAFSLISGSPRALLARDGLMTAGWAGYMYLSVLARRPATYTVSRALLEGRRVYDPATYSWVRPAVTSWDELWARSPRFRQIWRTCTIIWATAMLADAVARVLMAAALPIGLVPALGGALWPVTFVLLQVVTNVYFARAGLWRMLRTGQAGQAGRAS